MRPPTEATSVDKNVICATIAKRLWVLGAGRMDRLRRTEDLIDGLIDGVAAVLPP
jgi:hypothetical protein